MSASIEPKVLGNITENVVAWEETDPSMIYKYWASDSEGSEFAYGMTPLELIMNILENQLCSNQNKN